MESSRGGQESYLILLGYAHTLAQTHTSLQDMSS